MLIKSIDPHSPVVRLCEHIYEIVIRAENRPDVLAAIANSSESSSEVLFNKIVECCRKHIENIGHSDDFAG